MDEKLRQWDPDRQPTRRILQSEWDVQKQRITTLYEQGLTYHDLQCAMYQVHGFSATYVHSKLLWDDVD